ncbi:MAG: FAD-dependent oxidoreductase [Planctomycetota bacterium]|jgi:NADPH-dependent glutamate synthase beta subunit-like oxidoreductase/coenzyme F420-reducing hydrogenase delta subunit
MSQKESQTQTEKLEAPCVAACPVHTDNRRLTEYVAHGRYEDALELTLGVNPFSSVCGRICSHPCEQECRRSNVEKPISLRMLKRFVIEQTEDYRSERAKSIKPVAGMNGKTVAIIGAGPSGMTATHDLAKAGYGVTVFERAEKPGGMLSYAIPKYRLPYEAVKQDVDDILALGVELKCGVQVGKDITIDRMKKDFDAVLISTGLYDSRSLSLPGVDSEGVILAMPFLRSVALGERPKIGKKVVVIGGGNVAVDVARCAKRIGAEEVTMVCLEGEDEMPAWKWEIDETLEEGIKISNSWGPLGVKADGGKVSGVDFKRCTCVFDDTGCFNPEYDDSDTCSFDADNVIMSIGQQADISCIEGSKVKIAGGTRLEYDQKTLGTSEPGVFASGEIAIGPGAAIQAVAEGRRAAHAIDNWLKSGNLMEVPDTTIPHVGELPSRVADKVLKRERREVELSDPVERVKNFDVIEPAFTEKVARFEAGRCMSCTAGAIVEEDKCAACLTCVRVCPFEVAKIDKKATMPADECQACGLCAAECPANAIGLVRWGVYEMKKQIKSELDRLGQKGGKFLVGYGCLFQAEGRRILFNDDSEFRKDAILKIPVPCAARLTVADLLAPFELGAAGVTVITCDSGDCQYPNGVNRIAARVKEAGGFLAQTGLGAEKIELVKSDGPAEAEWPKILNAAKEKLG